MRTCPMRGPGVKFDEVKSLLNKTIDVSLIFLKINNVSIKAKQLYYLMFQLEMKWKVIIRTVR